MEDKEIKLLEEYLEEARDENSFTDCEGLFEDKFFISLDKLLKRYKELEEENESLVRQYEHQGAIMVNEYFSKEQVFKHFIPISVIQNKIDELKHRKSKDEFEFACKLKGILYLQELLEERSDNK